MGEFENTMEIPVLKEKENLIENIELRNFLQFKLGKENITNDDLDNIDEIILDSTNIVGQYNKVYFEEIDLFKNLKKISIRNLGVTVESLEKINKIPEVEFVNCELRDITKLSNVQHLTLINSEVDNFEKIEQLSNITELQLTNIKIEEFKFLENFKNLKKLVIKNVNDFSLSKINFYLPIEYLSVEKIKDLDLNIISQYENLKTLSVDRIEADNWENELKDLKNKNIEILLNDMYEF